MTPRYIPLQFVRRALRWCNLVGSDRTWVDAHQRFGHAVSVDRIVNRSYNTV